MTTPPQAYTPSELLPMAGDFVLLDSIDAWGDDWLEATVQHRGPTLFSDADGSVPGWVGLEYMAQAIAALAGIRNLAAGRGKRIGFLLGTRKYQSYLPRFEAGQTLTVRAEELLCDADNLGVFNCTIRSQNALLAEASVKVVQPENVEAILEGSQAL